MIQIKDKRQCSGCFACYNVCPKKCIVMNMDDEGFWYPKINEEQCINCGMCEVRCPVININQKDKYISEKAFATINLNEDVRFKSSSGGIFSLLAEEIIKQDGIVFGAIFSDDCKTIYHMAFDNIEDLDKLRGSKYVQSKIGDSYEYVKNYLDKGRKVLFTGTPCQIEGLYSYLNKYYDGLYTQDIICHGVPSPKVWKKYVEEREQKASSKTNRVFFRYKKYGWKAYSLLFEYKNNSKYIKSLSEDSYMRIFLSDNILRPSCYNCAFKGTNRKADITLGDYWGVGRYYPKLDDDKGVSAVIVNSEKGLHLIESISDFVKIENTSIENVINGNPAMIDSAKMGRYRNEIFAELESKDIDQLADKYCAISFKTKVKNMLIKMKVYNRLVRVKHKLKK